MGPGQDHRGRPRAAARPRLQRLNTSRVVAVDPERITRFLDGVAARHGALSVDLIDGERGPVLRVRAQDGALVTLENAWTTAHPTSDDPLDADALVRWAAAPPRLGLVLVRRGGYAVGTSDGDRLATHHTGSRYVQSRTAKGGWSQQRFARRRANQADELVGAAAERARLLLVAREGSPLQGLVLGGDKALLADLIEDRRLRALLDLPRREFHDLPDPRFAVLTETLRRARALVVTVTDPAE